MCELCSIPLILRTSWSRLLLDSAQAAAIIKVHPKTLQRYARHGIVVGLRVGRLWRFRASDLIPPHLENDGEDLDEDA